MFWTSNLVLLSLLFIAVSHIAVLNAQTVSLPPDAWKQVCALGGGEPCQYPIQAVIKGYALQNVNLVHQGKCLNITTKSSCDTYKANSEEACIWCDIKTPTGTNYTTGYFENKYGNGACLSSKLGGVPGVNVCEALLYNHIILIDQVAVDLKVPYPKFAKQTECLVESVDETSCNAVTDSAGHKCSFCAIPPIYNWQQPGGFCFDLNFMTTSNDQHKPICEKIQALQQTGTTTAAPMNTTAASMNATTAVSRSLTSKVSILILTFSVICTTFLF